MINWVIGLFVAALVAAFLGFGGVATTFAEVARILFFILAVLLVVSSVVALFGSRAPSMHAFVRTASLVAVAAVISIGAYAWFENDMSAERVGREIDRQTMAFADTAGATLSDAGARTGAFVQRTAADIRNGAQQFAQNDTASDDRADDTSNGSRD